MSETMDGVAPLVDRFDLFIVDLWGVLHDGARPYPGAREALTALKNAGKQVMLLSNAPRQARHAERRLLDLGFDLESWDVLLTSGEVAWRALRDRPDDWHAALGTRGYLIGADDKDAGMLEGNGCARVADIAEAEFLLCCGVPFGAGMDAVEDALAAGLARRLPMLCANPDLEVIHAGRREICAGRIAAEYSQRGGDVRRHGKPDRPVYDLLRALAPEIPAHRCLAIGDSLRTDIAGAQGAGLAGCLVTGGIHAEALGVAGGGRVAPDALAALLADADARPEFVIPAFRW